MMIDIMYYDMMTITQQLCSFKDEDLLLTDRKHTFRMIDWIEIEVLALLWWGNDVALGPY